MPNEIGDDKRYLEWITKITATICSGFDVLALWHTETLLWHFVPGSTGMLGAPSEERANILPHTPPNATPPTAASAAEPPEAPLGGTRSCALPILARKVEAKSGNAQERVPPAHRRRGQADAAGVAGSRVCTLLYLFSSLLW